MNFDHSIPTGQNKHLCILCKYQTFSECHWLIGQLSTSYALVSIPRLILPAKVRSYTAVMAAIDVSQPSSQSESSQLQNIFSEGDPDEVFTDQQEISRAIYYVSSRYFVQRQGCTKN